MRHHNTFSSKIARRTRRQRQRGVALVTTLLLLLLLTAVSLTMVLSVSSDMLINGYYAGYRSSFYAADSGINMARQDIVARILGSAPATFAAGASPIPLATNFTGPVQADYNGPTQINTAGSWPETFQIINTANNPTTVALAPNGCTVTFSPLPKGTAVPTCAAPNGFITSWKYVYNYTVSVAGHSQGSEISTVTDTGSITLTANIKPAGPQQLNFAAFGTFIDNYPPCSAPFVPGTLTGQFFTNGAWNFGDSGQYVFQNSTGQADAQASFWHSNGACDNVAGKSDTNGTTVAPTFKAGFNLGAAPLPLPTDSFNQEQAVLDGKGIASGQPSNTTLNANLQNPAGLKVPSTGVYLPYSKNSKGQNVFSGGGIYVQGDAKVTLAPSGAAGETYTIDQSATGGPITTVTVDNGAQTTTMISGGVTTVITGVPAMYDQSTGAFVEDATMLYVNGNITSLSGPGENQTAVNNGIALTVTAAGNVTITGDIRYAAEPVTTANNQIPGQPADTLIPGNDHGQVLGVFTASGDVQMNNQQSDGNLWIDASIAMISQGGTGGWINVGPHINNLNLLGGRIANQAKSGNTTTRNIFFDQRFGSGGFSPPWFPSTTIQNGTQDSATFVQPTVRHVQWLNTTSYQ
jgi:Tfp pilus assembly protein PilX